jgi:hypothetical protein
LGVILVLLTEGHPVLSLRAVAMTLLADRYALLRAGDVAAGLLALLLLRAHRMRIPVAAATRLHLEIAAMAVTTTAAVERLHADGIAAAAVAVTAATAAAVKRLHAESAAAATTTAALRVRMFASAALVHVSGSTAALPVAAAVRPAATTVRSRSCRG